MLLKLGYQQRIFNTNSPPKRNAGSPQKRLMKQHSEGCLEAEAGDVSILKMETEHSSKPVPANFSTGSAGPAAPRLFWHRQFEESQTRSPGHMGEGSLQAGKSDFQFPSPLDFCPFHQRQAHHAVASSREQGAFRRTKLSICQHHLQIPHTEDTEAVSNPTESKEWGCWRKTDDTSCNSWGHCQGGSVYLLSSWDTKIQFCPCTLS